MICTSTSRKLQIFISVESFEHFQAELSFRFVLICETVLWISSHEVLLVPSTQ